MKRFPRFRAASALLAAILAAILIQAASAFAERWSFAAISDVRPEFAAYTGVLRQIKSGRPEDPNFPPAQLVLAVGDIDPLIRTVIIHQEVMGRDVPFIPVRGNHEGPEDLRYMLKKVLPGMGLPIEYYDSSSATYCLDWKNARFIVIDRYTEYARKLKDPAFLQWLEKAITSAAGADHVFIAFHEPYAFFFPENDLFGKILIRHSDKVRAVFNGHMHCYARHSIQCPRGPIHLINTGNAGSRGHSDGNLTTVEVAIDGKQVVYRAVQAPHGTGNFAATDQWPAFSRRK